MAGAEGGIVDTPVHSLPMVAVCAGPAELAPIPYLYTIHIINCSTNYI